MDSDNRLVLKGDKIYRKLFINEVNGSIPETIWTGLSNYANAKDEIKAIFNDAVFDTPKPLRLIDRILRIATGPNDIILDSFAGSGTTAHAVLALNKEDGGNRRFILVECEDYADSITAERVRRVIKGVPGAKDKVLREGLGGGFAYCELGEPLGVEGMLTGEALPEFPALAAFLLYEATGISADRAGLQPQNGEGLFYDNGRTGFYLLYEPSLKFLESGKSVLTEARAAAIAQDNGGAGREEAVVFAAAQYPGQRRLANRGIKFYQLPWELRKSG